MKVGGREGKSIPPHKAEESSDREYSITIMCSEDLEAVSGES